MSTEIIIGLVIGIFSILAVNFIMTLLSAIRLRILINNELKMKKEALELLLVDVKKLKQQFKSRTFDYQFHSETVYLEIKNDLFEFCNKKELAMAFPFNYIKIIKGYNLMQAIEKYGINLIVTNYVQGLGQYTIENLLAGNPHKAIYLEVRAELMCANLENALENALEKIGQLLAGPSSQASNQEA